MKARKLIADSIRRRIDLSVLVGVLLSIPAVAHASTVPVTVPPATYGNSVQVTYPNTASDSKSTDQATGGLAIVGANDSIYWGATTSNDYNTPSLYAAVRGSGKETAGSNLTYYFELQGNPGSVDMRVSAYGTADTSPEADHTDPANQDSAAASVTIRRYNSSDDAIVAASNTAFYNESKTITVDGLYSFKANTIYEVHMDVGASAVGGDKAIAFVDPYFYVPDGYSFLESDNIGNSLPSPTPIPATLPLFVSALGGLGFVGWQRRKGAV